MEDRTVHDTVRAEAALRADIERPTLSKRPVAFRVFIERDIWFLSENEALCSKLADALGTQYHGLYVRDGT
jgi:hypothetical protein